MNNDGTLTLDTATLTNAVQNNFAAVQNFMQGASSNGFVSNLNNQLSTLTDPTSGAFTVDLQSISSENKDLQTQINNFQTYLNDPTDAADGGIQSGRHNTTATASGTGANQR